MKKSVIALAIFSALAFTACVGEDNGKPAEIIEPAEDSLKTVTGVAIDGAMNSVFIKVGEDTLGFNYPDLDNDHRDSWSIDDTVTVKYYETENGDSVTDVIVNE